MSRTRRRTNAPHLFCDVDKIEDVSRWDLEHAGLSSAQVYVNQRVARFHRDNQRGSYGAPRWFRNRLNRRDRRATRAQIFRHQQEGCWEGHLPQRQVRNAIWLWF